jgi:hypothetical protein
MKPRSTTTSRKPRKRARNGAITSHQNRKNSAHNDLRARLCWLFLGWMRGNFGALHAQGEHCDQCNVCRSPQESPASCNQVQTRWTSEYRCFVVTWQCSAPYCPFNCCNNPRSIIRVSSTSAVLARPRPKWFLRLWTTQRGDGLQVFQVRWRGAAGGARVAAVSAKILFFSRDIHALQKRSNTCMVRNGDYVEKWSNCVPYIFYKLREKKIFKVFIWLTHAIITPESSWSMYK